MGAAQVQSPKQNQSGITPQSNISPWTFLTEPMTRALEQSLAELYTYFTKLTKYKKFSQSAYCRSSPPHFIRRTRSTEPHLFRYQGKHRLCSNSHSVVKKLTMYVVLGLDRDEILRGV
ncbi:hypothetical protein WG66_007881 [Moniliophthora roreri]|nr:hypothetical protein WG66_007881 [Moniliophthora roreri]